MHEYGRPEDDFGYIAINARRWSALNSRAVLRDPLSMDDYLSCRTIVPPLRLLDCDYPINGAVATVFTTAERAKDLRQPVVLVDCMTYATGRRVDWIYVDDFLNGATIDCARAAVVEVVGQAVRRRRRAALRRVHDGDDVVARGARVLRHGRVRRLGRRRKAHRAGRRPSRSTRPAGSSRREGCTASSFLNEATLQLRGQTGQRQVPDAQVAVVASGLYPQCGAMVLTRQ